MWCMFRRDLAIQQWKEMSPQARKKHGGNCVALNERSPSEKTTYCKILTIWYSGKDKTTETEKKKINDCCVEEDE